MSEYQIILSKNAQKLLTKIKDRREQQLILTRLTQLKLEPEKQGKPLLKNLKGYRSIRAIGQRYRIIYQIQEDKVIVLVVAIGIRKQGDQQDIYEITKQIISNLNQEEDDL